MKNRIHFVGIGGIGMSALAQAYRWADFEVSGSDRALNNPENIELFNKLKKQGITLYKQDGSFAAENKTDLIIYSTAIEDDNPDFIAGEKIEKWHRAKALTEFINHLENKTTVAVSGSCGKTTVTSWIGETMALLGFDPIVLNGGMISSFSNETYTGNFRPGKGDFFIYEADESDKSLVAFFPDYSVVLNIGTDHYSKEELLEVFEKFLKNTKRGSVIEKTVLDSLRKDSYAHLNINALSFGKENATLNTKVWKLHSYKGGLTPEALSSYEGYNFSTKLPLPGIHNANNALAVVAIVNMITKNRSIEKIANAVSLFKGVHRRFEYKGKTSNGASIIDDYAHNVEKIISCIKTAQEISKGKVIAVFQPHGYGPFKFMKDFLFPELESALRKEDKFIFLPVFYAGGTSSFTPKSSEVTHEYQQKTKRKNRYLYFEERISAKYFLFENTTSGDTIIVMGARDSSLAIWAESLSTNEYANSKKEF